MTFLKQMIDNEKERSETMRILALDSSGLVASVAVVEEEQTIAEYTVNYKKTHSQTLLPMLDEIVKMTEMNLGEMQSQWREDLGPLPGCELDRRRRKDLDSR